MPEFDPKAPVTADNFERVMAALMEQGEARHNQMLAELREAVAEGTHAGMERTVKDERLMRDFAESLYEKLAKHTRDDVSRSIGSRVISWTIFTLLGAALALAALQAKK